MSLFVVSAQAQTADTQEYGRVTGVPRAEIDRWLKDEVGRSGGDWSKDRYHFYIGFSTGHFGQDPLHAIAMRRLAFSLMNNSLAVGDRVTPLAWEMAPWNVGATTALSDDAQTRAAFVNGVPYAPQSNSRGGHDIERTLYEILTKTVPAEESGSAIVLLLTNSNASQAPNGDNTPLFGANNSQLADAITKGGFRLPLVRKEFKLESPAHPVTVAITALFPTKLVSLPDAPGSPRYPTFARETWQPSADKPAPADVLPNPTAAAKAVPASPRVAPTPADNGEKKGGVPLLAIVLSVLLVVGIIAFLLRLRPKSVAALPTVAKTTVPLGVPIPGAITIAIGAKEQKLFPLTTVSQWMLRQTPGAAPVLVPQVTDKNAPVTAAANTPARTTTAATPTTAASSPANATNAASASPTDGNLLARLDFDPQKRLRVQAESGVQFTELSGTDIANQDGRTLLLSPGKMTRCKIATSDSSATTLFVLTYQKEGKA